MLLSVGGPAPETMVSRQRIRVEWAWYGVGECAAAMEGREVTAAVTGAGSQV